MRKRAKNYEFNLFISTLGGVVSRQSLNKQKEQGLLRMAVGPLNNDVVIRQQIISLDLNLPVRVSEVTLSCCH